jgi:hypothetical protein
MAKKLTKAEIIAEEKEIKEIKNVFQFAIYILRHPITWISALIIAIVIVVLLSIQFQIKTKNASINVDTSKVNDIILDKFIDKKSGTVSTEKSSLVIPEPKPVVKPIVKNKNTKHK